MVNFFRTKVFESDFFQAELCVKNALLYGFQVREGLESSCLGIFQNDLGQVFGKCLCSRLAIRRQYIDVICIIFYRFFSCL